MTSFTFSGSPWFLLLLVPGAFILWRQYRGRRGGRSRGSALLALQAAALLILVVSLTGPEQARRHAEFRDPAVTLLRDRSGSFAAGAYLGLGDAYAEVETAIAAAYRARGFEVRMVDFDETARPVAAFAGGRAGSDGTLTSLATLADYLDSAGGPNLQAAFLLSDGRANLDSGVSPRAWSVPVYPVVLPVTGLAEAQLEEVSLLPGEVSAGAAGEGILEVTWEPVGPPAGPPSLRILQGSRQVFAAELSMGGSAPGARTARIPWRAPSALLEQGSLRAVLQPTGSRNVDPWNDTLSLAAASGRGGGRLLVVKPLRGLDEKGMMDLLRRREDLRVGMVAPPELGAARLTEKDQVWVEAGLAASPGPVLEALRRTSARVVLYARPGALPASLAGLALRRGAFSPAAEARPARAAADVFPSGVVRLSSISEGSLEAPLPEAPWREAAVLAEGGRKGLLMGWFPLGGGKQALFLVLPSLWNLLFDPQADFAAREALEGLLAAAWALAERDEGAFKVLRPRVAYSDLPFDLEFTLPGPAARRFGDLELRAREAGGRTERLELEAAAGGAYRARNISISAGAWLLELARSGEVLWLDSLPVKPRAALELARIGFDRASLLALAAASGGRLLEPDAAARVTSMLPEPRGSQIKVERTTAIKLYNTRLLFLLAVALLAASWLLRKRWDLD